MTAPVSQVLSEAAERAAMEALRRWHRDSCYPEASPGELKIGLYAVLAALAKEQGR